MNTSVLFVTEWFAPEPVPVPVSIARSLQRRGLDVQVLTAHPNYPSGQVHQGFDARRTRRDVIDGLPVWRAPLLASHNNSTLRRFVTYLSWAMTASRLGTRPDADVCLVYSSPATAALPAMWRRRRRGTPYVLLVQDIWPDSIFASGFLSGGVARRWLERLLSALVRRTYDQAAAVAVISPGARRLLTERGVPDDKLHLVYNWVEGDADQPVARHPELREQLGLGPDDVLFVYAGNHGKAQALDVLVDAFARLGAQGGCHLALVGDGICKPELQAQARGLAQVHFLDTVPSERMAWIAAGCDAQVVSLGDAELFKVTMPSKVQSILAAGLPVLSVAPGDAAEVVASAGAGVSARPGSATDVARAVRELADLTPQEREEMGRRGRELYLTQMSEDVGAGRLVDLLQSTAAERSRTR